MKNIFRYKPAYISGLIALLFVFGSFYISDSKISADEMNAEIDTALYEHQEFFGSSAIVPLPTLEARENLAKLVQNQPDNREILVKLSELDEKLSRFDESEKTLIHLTEIDFSQNENLIGFYERRARFDDEARVLQKMLFAVDAEKRAAIFERLIYLARVHDLKDYLNQDFYAKVVKENSDVFTVFETIVDKLAEEKDYAEALKFLRQAKIQFPERKDVLLKKEIEILVETKQTKEAQIVYEADFNPFWSDDEADKFYQFLDERNQLRVYGAELKNRIRRNPADFDASVRYALYRKHDYAYEDGIAPIILKLEAAKKTWTTDELVMVTRLLLRENEGETASRFLYTLYLRDDFKSDKDLRAKILYQIFEMFSDAENQRLPITKGDLRFYEDVAQSDTNPGIATGILSLIFSDTNPRQQLENQEAKATKYFNRAAAYRVFLDYKEEFPEKTELAQMYLDIVRLYTATKETTIAEKTLDEFAAKFENSENFPAAALKLADAFIATKQPEKERETYQKILDYLGKQNKSLAPKVDSETSNGDNKSIRNDGIIIPTEKEAAKTDVTAPHVVGLPEDYTYDNKPKNVFRDYLARNNSKISYSEVLEIFVASLAKDKQTSQILEVYSREIGKYPNEEWLYEQRLVWLEQTNLTDEQLKVYQMALARFQSRTWQDKLARFFLRQNRKADFADFSEDLIGKLNDADSAEYLSQFAYLSAKDFENQLYLKLYLKAHERFPHNIAFVKGLLSLYKISNSKGEWRKLCAAYYFESSEIRDLFLDDLAKNGEIRNYLQQAKGESSIYELFRADASARLSDYENAVAAYRKLNRIYPNTPEFNERLINFTRSFGQKNRELLIESSGVAKSQADFEMSSAEYRTRSGEIFAELGSYDESRKEWEKLISLGAGDSETYLDTATLYWDYFQYADAIRTIKTLRVKFSDENLYAFETGAILEAQHKQRDAIGEYVKALDANRDETQSQKASKRLARLFRNEVENNLKSKKSAANQVLQMIDAAYADERARRKDASFLALGYAQFLAKIKSNGKAESVLNAAMTQSRNQDFLESARDFYESENIVSGEEIALKRLSETTENSRQTIQYGLKLAENYETNQNRVESKNVISRLVAKFPTNYGVLNEAANFYWRLGYENESIAVLRNSLPKSRGKFRNAISVSLAKRLIQRDELDSAEKLLTDLHDEDKADAGVFGEMARIYVRQNQPEKLRKTFAETIVALKKTDVDRRELDEQIAGLRTEMIDSFTRLKDYKSAIEQHIEIINREPENEELTENALRYVQRYGGAETLLSYYQKVSAEAFKNYRWNVVLAKIYESKNDSENAVKNYRNAINNQPEMPELYVAIADIETKRGNFDEALKNLDTVLELTNDAPEYVKKKIEILKKAGKLADVEAEKAKLPAEIEPAESLDRFAEARNLEYAERDKARELYKKAFNELLENPVKNDLKSSDIAAYVRTVRDEESLDEINERLWVLRNKLVSIADAKDSADAGEARNRLSVLSGAMTESIGEIAKTFATEDENLALHEFLMAKINENYVVSDEHQTVSLIQNLSHRAGFGDLEEAILIKKFYETTISIDKDICKQNLVDFYNERGAYQKIFDFLEKPANSDLPLEAETARLIGNNEKELEALRAIYWETGRNAIPKVADVQRYLEILQTENREELKSLTAKNSIYQLQLINFLLGAGMRDLAHTAIINSSFPTAWKVSRNAETSLALKEFDDSAECYFCDALQFESIGEMVRQNPDKKRFLINDDWFKLTREYGEWVTEKHIIQSQKGSRESSNADKYLVAMTENLPNDDAQQFKLGVYYLEQNQLDKAIEHLRLSIEIENLAVDDRTKMATLGVALYKSGKREEAESLFVESLEFESIENDSDYVKIGADFFKTLQTYGLASQGRGKLPPVFIRFLINNNADKSEDFQNLVRAVANSFTNEADKSAYFMQILQKRPTDTSLAEMLLSENLIEKNNQNQFYELLINRSAKSFYSDYSFSSTLRRAFDKNDVESVYDQENDYKVDESGNERLEWQKKYLAFLIEQRENSKAAQIIAEIEKEINGRYARPDWLRLAKIRLQIRDGKFDSPEIERFVGITVSDSVNEIKPPSVERFNDVWRVLHEEKRDAEITQISEAYFLRTLALEGYDKTNFVGLAQVFFQKGEDDKALRVLSLMVDANDDAKRETASAEIASLETVKARIADTAKFTKPENEGLSDKSGALKIAAETASEFGQTEAAIAFRRQLSEINPSDSTNKIELSKLLIGKGETREASNILTEIIVNRDSARSARWQARTILVDAGENLDLPNVKFDSLSQFYNGLSAEKSGENEVAIEFFTNSIIDDEDAKIAARQQLIKIFAMTNKHFAALKIAETDKNAKSDELLETLSQSAEKIGNFRKAIEFENAKSSGANVNRIKYLQNASNDKNRRATDFAVNSENTRKL